MQSQKKIPLLLLLCLITLTGLAGCSSIRPVVLHPIEQSDIVILYKGDKLEAPKDGAFLSSYYIEEVMKAKVGK